MVKLLLVVAVPIVVCVIVLAVVVVGAVVVAAAEAVPLFVVVSLLSGIERDASMLTQKILTTP